MCAASAVPHARLTLAVVPQLSCCLHVTAVRVVLDASAVPKIHEGWDCCCSALQLDDGRGEVVALCVAAKCVCIGNAQSAPFPGI